MSLGIREELARPGKIQPCLLTAAFQGPKRIQFRMVFHDRFFSFLQSVSCCTVHGLLLSAHSNGSPDIWLTLENIIA